MGKTTLQLLVLFCALMVAHTTAFAGMHRGYILKKDGKKNYGFIKTRNVTGDEIKITFYKTRASKKEVYRPHMIDGYGYEYVGENEFGERAKRWRHYKSKLAQSYSARVLNPKLSFMEVMEEGEIMLYDFYVETPTNFEQQYKRFFYLERKNSGELVEVSKSNFMYVAKGFFSDNREIADKVGDVNYRFRHLWKLVRAYNDSAENKQAELYYDYQLPEGAFD